MLTCSDFLFVVGRVAASEGRSVKRRRRIKSTGTSHTDTRGVKRRAQERQSKGKITVKVRQKEEASTPGLGPPQTDPFASASHESLYPVLFQSGVVGGKKEWEKKGDGRGICGRVPPRQTPTFTKKNKGSNRLTSKEY